MAVDLLVVYNASPWLSGNFLWRVKRRDSLQTGETPLVTQFEKGFECELPDRRVRSIHVEGTEVPVGPALPRDSRPPSFGRTTGR